MAGREARPVARFVDDVIVSLDGPPEVHDRIRNVPRAFARLAEGVATLNLDDPDEGTEGVDLVPHKAKKRRVRAALNNSFGFGGTNASLIVKAV